ncbi:MAG: hypothetical protein IJR20_06930 [Muribaculaceae bacterium]|nr:hypothetical protein [Muribaculaceae bacterium]
MKSSMIFKSLRIFFGIFMILIYLGMAYLLYINFFDWNSEPWLTLRYIFAAILAIYGVYRCYRQVKGTDYYRLKDMEERFENDQQQSH